MRNTTAKNVMRKSRITLVAPLLLCLVLSQYLAAQRSYTVTDVGRVNDLNDETAGAAGINNAGLVVGQALLPSGPDRAFLWIRGDIFDLGTFGGSASGARAINARGDIVGKADTFAGPEHAFFWETGKLLDLGTFGGAFSEANGINARGWTVGFSATTIPDPTGTTGPQESHAFVRIPNGPLQDIGTLGGPNSIAIGINDNGRIVGWSQVDFNIGDFGIPDLHAATWVDGVITDLGGLGGAVTLALAANNRGVAVGQSFLAGNPTFHAVLWENGTLHDLGTLPGDFASAASDINSKGTVVGASLSDTFSPRAFIWQSGVMTDLNSLIHAGSGWFLLSATHINDTNQIVGNGFFNGELHAFLLTPSFGGGRTGSPKTSSPVSLSDTTRQWLIWGRSGLLKHESGRFKSH